MHSKSDNIEIMIFHKADAGIEKLFESLLYRYQIDLEKSVKGSGFIFDCIDLLHCKCYKTNLYCSGS